MGIEVRAFERAHERDCLFVVRGLFVRMKHNASKCRSLGGVRGGIVGLAWVYLADPPATVRSGGVLGLGGNG